MGEKFFVPHFLYLSQNGVSEQSELTLFCSYEKKRKFSSSASRICLISFRLWKSCVHCCLFFKKESFRALYLNVAWAFVIGRTWNYRKGRKTRSTNRLKTCSLDLALCEIISISCFLRFVCLSVLIWQRDKYLGEFFSRTYHLCSCFCFYRLWLVHTDRVKCRSIGQFLHTRKTWSVTQVWGL